MEENPYKYTTFWAEWKENTFLTILPCCEKRQKNVLPAHVYLLSMLMQKLLHCNLKNILFPFAMDNYTETVEVL
jgi:hypothetical protein